MLNHYVRGIIKRYRSRHRHYLRGNSVTFNHVELISPRSDDQSEEIEREMSIVEISSPWQTNHATPALKNPPYYGLRGY